MRATTAFNKLLRLPGATVNEVRFGAEGVVVGVRLRRRRRVCSGCGQIVGATHDTATRRWRHLDLGGTRCYLEAELRRVKCPDCGVRVEAGLPLLVRGSRPNQCGRPAWSSSRSNRRPAFSRTRREDWFVISVKPTTSGKRKLRAHRTAARAISVANPRPQRSLRTA